MDKQKKNVPDGLEQDNLNNLEQNESEQTQETRGINEEAYDLLDEAMTTSSRVSKKEIERNEIDWDNVYPTTKAETEHMEQLLEEAWQKADDVNEQGFSERYQELREIVNWSKKRHRTWAWSLIAGALLGAGLFWYWNDDDQKEADRRKAEVVRVQDWAPSDTSVSYKNCPEVTTNMYNEYANRASKYKLYKLASTKDKIIACEKSIKDYKQRLDTCTNEKSKKNLEDWITRTNDDIVKHHAEYDSINAMKFDQIKEMAIKEFTRSAEWKQDSANSMRNYMIYLFLLIPFYIIASYPRGYSITKHNLQRGCLTGFRKIGFGLASFCFGAGVAMALLPDYKVKTTYSDGSTSTHTESNAMNIPILVMKFGLMIVGAFIFIFVSAFVMTVETILGLFQNFEWGSIFAKVKGLIAQKKSVGISETK